MYTINDVLRSFFVHKDFLPPANIWPGTLFSPLQIAVCAAVAVFIGFACLRCARKSQETQNRVFLWLWALMLLTEIVIDIYDSCAGKAVFIDWTSILPLWHCSIFLYVLPFAVFAKGKLKEAACGYICTLGLLGGAVNFVYPASYLSYYSCISFTGVRTIFYHSAMIFTAVTMLLSGYHSFKGYTEWKQLLLPSIPSLLVSVPANIVNFTVEGADYMFFKLESFFFAPLGQALPKGLTVVLVYILLILVQTAPYVPSYLKARKSVKLCEMSN